MPLRQSEERQDDADDYDEANDVNDVIHGDLQGGRSGASALRDNAMQTSRHDVERRPCRERLRDGARGRRTCSTRRACTPKAVLPAT